MPEARRPGADGPAKPAKTVNLALQGGGAHGAFAWGVLDRLLEDQRVDFEGLTATSAGAMNAAVFAHGLMQGGRAGAREALATFWGRVAELSAFSPVPPNPFGLLFGSWGTPLPGHMAFDMMTRLVSPYQFNPLNVNPLLELLRDQVDFEGLQRYCPIRLFVSATNVRNGKIRVFRSDEMTAEAVMASACLPNLFQAVEIDGEAYWDGGYTGNPAIFPLIYNCESRDVVIVHINPIYRPEVPTDPFDILNRVNEVSFNSSLMREMRAIAFVSDMIDKGQVVHRPMKRMLIHAVEAEATMRELSVQSKLAPSRQFLEWLRDIGRETAETWLEDTYDKLGAETSIDLSEWYL
jgi:NTE family protein